jgi:tRNA(Ile2) C34 agmatinyltransferase TiaS
MDITRCPKCKRRLMALTDQNGRTDLRCLKCDTMDPMKTDVAKWVDSSLAEPPKAAARVAIPATAPAH